MTTQTDGKSETKSYKETLNLPQTAFAMEAKLVANEPLRLRRWEEMKLYEAVQKARANDPAWVLHDGPPFANGDIHIGHLFNKTLKDIILRFRTMQGHRTPYVPGWDCHGLPIEHKIQQELGPKLRQMSTLEVRRLCFDYASKFATLQSQQFQRLGILADWAHPYLTMAPGYEAATLEVFAKFVEAGLVFKQLKPVPWSVTNRTALADAELEYQDVTDSSVFVEFAMNDPAAAAEALSIDPTDELRLLVWTTTPWTLPANLAVAVNPTVDYAVARYETAHGKRVGVLAAALVEKVLSGREGVSGVEVIQTVSGANLLGLVYRHPFIDRTGRIVGAEYVTTTDGTGLVHTAPGHGEDDYITGLREKLEVYSPVRHDGRFDDTVPQWLRGLTVWEANPIITRRLAEDGSLLAEEKITHSYPHDWRSKTPVIFRAMEQWFVALDRAYRAPGEPGDPVTLRDRARRACRKDVKFIPEWGGHRIGGMIDSRPDWCITRQRAWGLPIPIFYNEQGAALLTPESVRAVARRFAEKGSDAWFTDSPAELLGADFAMPAGFDAKTLRKETDIFDVWFESGSSWHAVLQARPSLHFPADLYLEGSDQHRGWFQLSLLPSLAATGRAPFKQVLTHGFIVKPDGTKVSKSDPEYVTAMQEVNRHGADLLRLWCCSVDYQGDIPASPKAIKDFGDKYRKIRNTLRYLLSNLNDFNPAEAAAIAVPAASLDGWALAELDGLIEQTIAAYDRYELHRVFRLLHDFCAVQISAVYGNAMKDRMYCEPPGSPLRRRSQSVSHRMVVALTKLLAPVLVFTADEAWEFIGHRPGGDADLASVHLSLLPRAGAAGVSESQRAQWATLMSLRDSALGQLDRLKKDVGMNKALDAEVIFDVDAATRAWLEPYGPDLEDMVGAGFHSFTDAASGAAVRLVDRRADFKACARSWKRRPDVGSDPRYPDLSARDAAAVALIQSHRA